MPDPSIATVTGLAMRCCRPATVARVVVLAAALACADAGATQALSDIASAKAEPADIEELEVEY